MNASPPTQHLSGFPCCLSLPAIPFPSLPRYYGLNAPLKHTHVELLTPNLIALAGETFQGWLCHEGAAANGK